MDCTDLEDTMIATATTISAVMRSTATASSLLGNERHRGVVVALRALVAQATGNRSTGIIPP